MALKLVLVCGILFSVPSFATGLKLNCTVTHNFKEVASGTVTLHPQERRLIFAEYEGFRFFLSDHSTSTENKTELQIYDSANTSRTYAVSDLSKAASLELTFWIRDYILTAHCKKH